MNRYGSRVIEIRGSELVVADSATFRNGDVIHLRSHVDSPARCGTLRVDDTKGCTLFFSERVHAAIPAACANDLVYIEAVEPVGLTGFIPTDDHATLVAYLLSAVRRKDWHAVSDAANDLRVLEASRR